MNRPCCAERSSELHRKSRRSSALRIRWTARSPAGVGRARCVPVAAPTMNPAGPSPVRTVTATGLPNRCSSGDAEGDPSCLSLAAASVAIAKSTTDSACIPWAIGTSVPGGLPVGADERADFPPGPQIGVTGDAGSRSRCVVGTARRPAPRFPSWHRRALVPRLQCECLDWWRRAST